MSPTLASTASRAIDVARAHFEIVSSMAVEVRDGSVTWIDPIRLAKGGPPVRLDAFFHGGIPGIAFFLAAVSRHDDACREGADLARRALGPLRGQLARLTADPERAASVRLSLGGTSGLGGTIYAFARIGHWLEDGTLLDEAHALASLITPERIAADRGLDIFNGTAGTLLAMLALDALDPDGRRHDVEPLTIARCCGEHLLATRIEGPAGLGGGGWPANGNPPWCGWAHGVAGMAHALYRLGRRTGERRFEAAALEALAFERRHFDPERQNWRDLRSEDAPTMTAVCHGAPGIALGRLGMLDAASEDPRIRDEVDVALRATREAEPTELDFVCCGNVGRLEVLFEGDRLDDPRLERSAGDRAADLAETRDGRFRWFDPPYADRTSPSFFTGAAGVGYFYLRLAVPEPLPCALTME